VPLSRETVSSAPVRCHLPLCLGHGEGPGHTLTRPCVCLWVGGCLCVCVLGGSDLEYKSFMGLFPEIQRAWLTIDNRLFLWNYEDG
jgi:hypothetical protein